MLLLIVRHAIAEDSAAGGDAARPLSARGRKRMMLAAHGLARVLEAPHVLASSPLVRAVQTADLLADVYPGARRVLLDELAPGGDLARLVARLAGYEAPSLAVVGHEPDLGALASLLLSGRHGTFVEMRKGAACLLRFDSRPATGAGTLLWHLPPRHLRMLGGPG